jgi:hydroxyacylglutathione hydrolase
MTDRFTRVIAIFCAVIIGQSASASACAPADITANDVVDVDDLLAVINQWGAKESSADIAPAGGNGIVDVDDLLAVINNWGPTGFASGTFPSLWINGGPNCGTEPAIQVHQFNQNTYILRQSLCTNFEAPFMFLLFGDDKVLLQDTGASNIPLASTVYALINQWLVDHNKTSIQLVVCHSHGHGDHVFNDSQFIGQPNTVVVGTSQTSVKNFFGITNWPTQIVSYNLGNRLINVIPIPGHHTASIALYDHQTHTLFTGDTLYPGRLYISNFNDNKASIQRLVDFGHNNPICHVLGTHIEMSNTPGDDYPMGATSHPNEHPLQLGPEHLAELNAALIAMQGAPHIEVHDEFIIWPF